MIANVMIWGLGCMIMYINPKHSLLLPQTYFDNNLFPFTGLYHNPIVYWGIDAN